LNGAAAAKWRQLSFPLVKAEKAIWRHSVRCSRKTEGKLLLWLTAARRNGCKKTARNPQAHTHTHSHTNTHPLDDLTQMDSVFAVF